MSAPVRSAIRSMSATVHSLLGSAPTLARRVAEYRASRGAITTPLAPRRLPSRVRPQDHLDVRLAVLRSPHLYRACLRRCRISPSLPLADRLLPKPQCEESRNRSRPGRRRVSTTSASQWTSSRSSSAPGRRSPATTRSPITSRSVKLATEQAIADVERHLDVAALVLGRGPPSPGDLVDARAGRLGRIVSRALMRSRRIAIDIGFARRRGPRRRASPRNRSVGALQPKVPPRRSSTRAGQHVLAAHEAGDVGVFGWLKMTSRRSGLLDAALSMTTTCRRARSPRAGCG